MNQKAALRTSSDWKIGMLEGMQTAIEDRLRRSSVCRIMLTRGRSARRLYEAWATSPNHSASSSGLQSYFGDERCDCLESNYRLASESPFPHLISNNMQVHRMESDTAHLDGAADCYAGILSDSIDILLLSMGEDGHIASLFHTEQHSRKQINGGGLQCVGPSSLMSG